MSICRTGESCPVYGCVGDSTNCNSWSEVHFCWLLCISCRLSSFANSISERELTYSIATNTDSHSTVHTPSPAQTPLSSPDTTHQPVTAAALHILHVRAEVLCPAPPDHSAEEEQEDVVFELQSGIEGILKDSRKMHYLNCRFHPYACSIGDCVAAGEGEWEVCRKKRPLKHHIPHCRKLTVEWSSS